MGWGGMVWGVCVREIFLKEFLRLFFLGLYFRSTEIHQKYHVSIVPSCNKKNHVFDLLNLIDKIPGAGIFHLFYRF